MKDDTCERMVGRKKVMRQPCDVCERDNTMCTIALKSIALRFAFSVECLCFRPHNKPFSFASKALVAIFAHRACLLFGRYSKQSKQSKQTTFNRYQRSRTRRTHARLALSMHVFTFYRPIHMFTFLRAKLIEIDWPFRQLHAI